MKCDITDLLIFFDELMPSTDEEQKVYWLKSKKQDQITIIFIVSVFEESVSIMLENEYDVALASIDIEKCSEVKILDQDKKCLEVLSSNGRCFLSLLKGSILSYAENK